MNMRLGENIMSFVRAATASDARAIAEIKIEAWRDAYKGILSEDTLTNKLDVDKQSDKLVKQIPAGTDNSFMFVYDDPERGILGYSRILIKTNTLHDEEDSFVGSVLRKMQIGEGRFSELYVKPQIQRQGIGKSLFEFVSNFARGKGIKTMQGNCFSDNAKGMSFHIKSGAKVLKKELSETWGEEKEESVLEWTL